jgi:hydrogenase maturation protease
VSDAHRSAVLVIGLGNELRRDDGAGLEIVRRMQAQRAGIDVYEHQGEPTGLLDAWDGRCAAIIVDSMRSGAEPGTIRRLDARREDIPARLGASSTHAIGVGEAIGLGRALDRLPARVIVYAVEGRRFDAGTGLSEELRAVVPRLTAMVLHEALALAES